MPEGAKVESIRIKIEKLREEKADARKRVLVARSCARVGEKDVVGEVNGVDVMGVRVAGRGARDRGNRTMEVEVSPKRGSSGHDSRKTKSRQNGGRYLLERYSDPDIGGR